MMNTRRKFIKVIGTGAALSSFSFSPFATLQGMMKENSHEGKNIRIGIIGAENGHTIKFGKLFNIEKKFPGVEVKYVWGETDEFAKKAAENGKIPDIIKDPMDMMGKIDALVVNHRHPKYHLEAAAPFIKAGIPIFIDKPFCYRVDEGKEFLVMARKYGTPVTSYSTVAHSYETLDIKSQLKEMGDVNNVVCYGPADFESPYGGIFFYGVHLVQPLMYLFDDDIERVKVTRNGNKGSIYLMFKNGLSATLVLKSLSAGWNTFIETKEGVKELKPRIAEPDPCKAYTDMVEMFRTRKEPRSHDHILKCVAVLEALEKSAVNEKWEEIKL